MSGRTKTRHIRRAKLIKRKPKERSIPWREVFKEEIEKYSEGGLMLRGSRQKEEITQKDLADAIGISQHHISEMENGKRPIGKAMAKKFGDFFKVDYRRFL
ncbi:MAG TPA: helix-turn-helix transcriptional regulator [Chlamydiales bacterium]|nr:helix-turn-helix transcriptional regulator [Chlamydiales bacterium]